jgi:hypothetical protein
MKITKVFKNTIIEKLEEKLKEAIERNKIDCLIP